MIPYQPRHPHPAVAPMPGASEQLTRVVYELLDVRDDTARIATGQHLDARWQAHLSYPRDLQRVVRELLARAGQQEAHKPSHLAMLRPESRECFGVSGVSRFECHLTS
jgi:hypothetical protein